MADGKGEGERKERRPAYSHDEMKQLSAQLRVEDANRAGSGAERIPKAHRQSGEAPVVPKYSFKQFKPSDDKGTIDGPMYPLAGHCLCEDFLLVVLNPQAGSILCHCYDCQINSASFFGAYVATSSIDNVILIPSQRGDSNGPLRDPEIGIYDAKPVSSGTSCPRTFCRTCGTMLYAEPATLKGIVVANRGLFQNHERHPSLIPQIEIFTTQRLEYMKEVHQSTRKYKTMPVPGQEDFSDEDSDDEDGGEEDDNVTEKGKDSRRSHHTGDEMNDD